MFAQRRTRMRAIPLGCQTARAFKRGMAMLGKCGGVMTYPEGIPTRTGAARCLSLPVAKVIGHDQTSIGRSRHFLAGSARLFAVEELPRRWTGVRQASLLWFTANRCMFEASMVPSKTTAYLPKALAGLAAACVMALGFGAAHALAEDADGQTHAVAMHGSPLHGPDFEHFDYVNPDAPTGGSIRFGLRGSFDSVNPLIVRGSPVWWVRGWVWESLATRGRDEAFTLYGLLAETIIVPEDRTYVTFGVNPEARFSDGEPVTADDVIFSMELLREHGRPSQRRAYDQITEVERLDDLTVTFHLGDGSNRELPILLGLLPVLPEHATTVEAFTETSLEPPIGSGPYALTRVDPGRLAVFERREDYWGADLPVNVGQYNVDEWAIEYFRDETALFEAFATGRLQLYAESDPVAWLNDYDFPAAASGEIVQSALEDERPKAPSGYVFNTRRAPFDDIRVRQALNLMFDFEWINQTIFADQYERTEGYFHGSELSAIGRPASEAELAILGDHVDAVLPEVLDGSWRTNISDGSGRDRANIRAGLQLLQEAGWRLDGRRLVNEAGEQMSFELLTSSPSAERVALAYAQTLQLAGIEMSVRVIDSAQFEERRRVFDFDMIPYVWYQSLSPGNEQYNRFGPSTADQDGSWNMAGITEPGVTAAIDAIVSAVDRDDLVQAARALDRLLISGSYIVPHYHAPAQWIAHASNVNFPENNSVWGYQFFTPNTIWIED
jgi:peptide/nickel transport system substrate-binding protein